MEEELPNHSFEPTWTSWYSWPRTIECSFVQERVNDVHTSCSRIHSVTSACPISGDDESGLRTTDYGLRTKYKAATEYFYFPLHISYQMTVCYAMDTLLLPFYTELRYFSVQLFEKKLTIMIMITTMIRNLYSAKTTNNIQKRFT